MNEFRKFSWYAKDPKKVSPYYLFFFLFGTVNLEINNKLEDLARYAGLLLVVTLVSLKWIKK